jgi:hypothetical protein
LPEWVIENSFNLVVDKEVAGGIVDFRDESLQKLFGLLGDVYEA